MLSDWLVVVHTDVDIQEYTSHKVSNFVVIFVKQSEYYSQEWYLLYCVNNVYYVVLLCQQGTEVHDANIIHKL